MIKIFNMIKKIKKRKIDIESIKNYANLVASWVKATYYLSLLSGVNINQLKELFEPLFDLIKDLTDAS